MPIDVFIKDKATGDFVLASLVEDVDPSEVAKAEVSWRPVREAAVTTLRVQGLTDARIAGH